MKLVFLMLTIAVIPPPSFNLPVQPLLKIFQSVQETIQKGCDVSILPDWVQWCGGTITKDTRLPEYTVCQSNTPDSPFLICISSRWRRKRRVSYLGSPFYEGREKRDIRRAYGNFSGSTCSLFCNVNNTGFIEKTPPTFVNCPDAVTLFPPGGKTNVTYNWTTPFAIDGTGENVTRVKQVAGPDPGSEFPSAVSPGNYHVISYLATDWKNMNWPCTFTVTAEVPTCPPLVNLTDGNTTCSGENLRGSTCHFTCNTGYSLNGSDVTVCQDNGAWSNMDVEPSCNIIHCDADFIGVNVTHADVICESDVYDLYDSVCWLLCRNGYLLRNDDLESDHVTSLSDTVTITTMAYNTARQEADEARDNATLASQAISDAITSLNDSLTNFIAVNASYHDTLDEVNTMNNTFQQLLVTYNESYEAANIAIENNFPNASDLQNVVQQIATELNKTIAEFENLQAEFTNLTNQYITAADNVINAQTAYDESIIAAEIAEQIADRKETDAQQKLEVQQAALAEFNAAVQYQVTGQKVVPSYIRCLANGGWDIPGNPYCEDTTLPDMVCPASFTVYLEPGQTSVLVDWTLPTASDNSGTTTIQRLFGPEPGSRLKIGQHHVSYQAMDVSGNTALQPCDIYINVEARTCDELRNHPSDDTIIISCESYQVGATCNLTCGVLSVLSGLSTAECRLNTSTTPPSTYWLLPDSYCQVETCPVPPSFEQGSWECTGVPGGDMIPSDNGTDMDNTTSGFACTAICDDGYVLPYMTASVYTCDVNGVWSSDSFPIECIEKGESIYSEYTLNLLYDVTDTCLTEDFDSIMASWEDTLLIDMMSYDVCLSDYECSLGLMTSQCNDTSGLVTIEFKIQITCADSATQERCNLGNDNMAQLMTSLQSSLDTSAILNSGNGSTTVLVTVESDIATCGVGAAMNGKYCEKCGRGTFYLELVGCLPCGPGSYSDAAGRGYCTTCPTMTSSLNQGAKSVEECIATCTVGTNSTTGNQPCISCPLGTYQDNPGSSSCIQCPGNTWTTIAGAANIFTDCVAYDIYMDTVLADQLLTTVSGHISVVLWTKKVTAPPLVTIALYNEQYDDFRFSLEISSTAELMFNNWDNEPTDIEINANVWTMVGLTWDPTTNNVTVYKDGRPAFNTTLPVVQQPEMYDRLVLSASSGTILSGLTVSNSTVSDDVMSHMFTNCSFQLPASIYTMDDLAGTRNYNFRFLPSTCIAANGSVTADYCGLNICQNGGQCIQNNTGGYTCNCTEQYAGPFCEEALVHGNWGDWMNRSSCSRTCGTGFLEQYRLCNNPPRSQYGNDCVGNNTEIIECFHGNCIECNAPPTINGEYCRLEDESCQPQCPSGYVLPPGIQGQTYHCGLSTQYTWTPLPTLPLCAVSIRPRGYTLRLTLTFVDPVPCTVRDAVIELLYLRVNELLCLVENPECRASLTINDCVGERRKRSPEKSTLDVTLEVEMKSETSFDLPTYYQTSQMTESIEEVLSAVSALERTQEDVVDDPSILNVDLDGTTYQFVADNVVTTATTNCEESQTAVGGVCASCQAGTMYKNGYCVLCDLGTYQNEAGKTQCIACERGKSTLYVGARQPSECVDVEFFPPDYTTLIVIVIASILAVVILGITFFLARRFYRSAKDREKHDMEADRVSLYTDFPDIAYNVYFKRRQVMGFDEDGYPIVAKTKFRTGDLRKKGQHDDSDTDDGGIVQSPLPTKKPFAYPVQDGQDAPFSYDPYKQWTVEDMVTLDREVKFDFPKIKTAVRYRMPGKNHLAHAYPLEMFGYTDDIRGRTRKLLPMPVNIPVPKKLPQLLYRPPQTDTLERRLSRDQTGHAYPDFEIGVYPRIPLLDEPSIGEYGRSVPPLRISGPFSKKKGGSPSKRSLMQAVTSSISPRTWTKSSARSAKSAKSTGRSKASAAASSPRDTKSAFARSTRASTAKPSRESERTVKSASVVSPGTPKQDPPKETVSPRAALMAIINEKKKHKQAFADDHDTPHPKPSRFMMPKDMSKVSLPPPPPRSMLKDSRSHQGDDLEEELRPATTISRKMVTINEDDIKETGPVISVTVNYPVNPSGSQWTDPYVLKHQRPVSDAKSARDTIVAPYSARPKSSFDKFLPPETKDSYRPTIFDRRSVTPASHLPTDRSTITAGTPHPLFDRRPITPAFHPRPVIHKDVKVQRGKDFTFVEPPTNLTFVESSAGPSSRMQHPPPFLNKVTPRASHRGSTSTFGTKFSPRDGKTPFSMKGFDDDFDDEELFGSRKNSFFFTEVPENSALSERITSRREGRRRGSQKPSPPPSYLDSRQDIVIEDSMSMSLGEE